VADSTALKFLIGKKSGNHRCDFEDHTICERDILPVKMLAEVPVRSSRIAYYHLAPPIVDVLSVSKSAAPSLLTNKGVPP
jgi:hypothetical protein